MTKDSVKYLLESFKFENQLLTQKQEELNNLNKQHFKKLQMLKPISIDSNQQIYNEAINKYKQESAIIENEIEKILIKRRDIEEMIECVNQPSRIVLYFKYVLCFSVEQIASKMCYSTQRIYQLLDSGIKQIIEKEEPF